MKILIVDDEPRAALLLSEILEDQGHTTKMVSNPVKALGMMEENFDILITDLNMPNINGIELLQRAVRIKPDLLVILITAYATVETAVNAMKSGAFDYIMKPFNEIDLIKIIDRAASKIKKSHNNPDIKDNTDDDSYEIIGDSSKIKALKELIHKVAKSDASVLITGESGTGKELVARNIHKESLFNQGRFVSINCAAINENLLESELFGYEKGAFTGADKNKIGLIEYAHNGTLFLDEIGEMTYRLQSKLLRVLQERSVTHLGGLEKIHVNVRIISATNRDLSIEIKKRTFREDLFYRLSVFPIHIPPLRDHIDDIPVLLEYILKKKNYKGRFPDDDLISALQHRSWNGNVREFENLIERAIILSDGTSLKEDDFNLNNETANNKYISKSENTLFETEKQMIVDALNEAQGNKTKAAQILGISRRMIYSKMNKYGLDN